MFIFLILIGIILHYCYFAFNTDDTLHFYDIDGPTQQGYLYTNRKFSFKNIFIKSYIINTVEKN